MPTEPQIKLLSYEKRSRFFWTLAGVFLVALPLLILYISGYRLTFEEDTASIVTTGALYISAQSAEAEVFLDEQPVNASRFFRSAFYIQTVPIGLHRISVQVPEYHTWVKILPVDPYLVTEAKSFAVPLVPQVRPITQYVSATGTPLVWATTTTDPYRFASTTVAYQLIAPETPTTTATGTIVANDEYDFVVGLFGTSTNRKSLLTPPETNEALFGFARRTGTTTLASTSLDTRYAIQAGEVEVYQEEGELYARWLGSSRTVPFYFCVRDGSQGEFASRYGTHVADAMAVFQTTGGIITESSSGRVCRPVIKLDRLRQSVYAFAFVPSSQDLILMLLDDAVYVTEIDDRSWQNTQRLYAGENLRLVVFGSVIYINDGTAYMAIQTEIES